MEYHNNKNLQKKQAILEWVSYLECEPQANDKYNAILAVSTGKIAGKISGILSRVFPTIFWLCSATMTTTFCWNPRKNFRSRLTLIWIPFCTRVKKLSMCERVATASGEMLKWMELFLSYSFFFHQSLLWLFQVLYASRRNVVPFFLFECKQVVLQILLCIVDLSSVRAVVMTMKVGCSLALCRLKTCRECKTSHRS